MLDWWIILQKFYYKIVECCLVLKKIFEKITSILQFSTFEKNCLNVMNYISKKKCFQFEKLIYFLDLTLFIAIKPSKNLGIFFGTCLNIVLLYIKQV